MQNTVFLVNDEPYCLWDADLRARNGEFLKGIDPDFFDYATRAHTETEDEKRASVALRLGLHHALETFFSLVGAYVQAPDCPYAWLAKCGTPALRSVVSRIHAGDGTLFTKLNAREMSWAVISKAVHLTFMPDTEQQSRTVAGFDKLWQRLAHEFLDPNHIDEYNSLKHGFRIGSGGFKLEVAADPSTGFAPTEVDFRLLGKSDFGSSYFKIASLTSTTGERSLTVSRHLNNWSLERVLLLAQAVHMSINNVVSALRVVNGVSPSECRFFHPVDGEDYLKAWNYSPGVTNLNWKSVADESNCRSVSKREILDLLARRGTD